MGKSNKFDYSNRPNSGATLGAIIGRSLEKEAEKVQRDADRSASKARKGSCSSTMSSADGRDGITHALDIKVPGKQLGDEGACAMFDGLEIALRQGTSQASLLLEGLGLAGNAISTESLARLAPIINLARHDLKTVDLSKNDIKVKTVEEMEEWEKFLRAFGRCLKLRRLDLTGNTKLGAKALEALARVYIAEDDINAMPATGMASVHSLPDEGDAVDGDGLTASVSGDAMTDGSFLQRRCGLRSIAYITLDNVGLTDAGALWLSYVVEDHYYPVQLIDHLNAAPVDSTIKVYQQSASWSGIEWSNLEPGLSRDGKNLLDKAERLRRKVMLADQIKPVSLDFVGEEADFGENNNECSPTRRSGDFRHRRAIRGDRHNIAHSTPANDSGGHLVFELESARKKIQRHVLHQHGVSSVELWSVGLRITIVAQILSGLGPASPRRHGLYVSPPMFDFTVRQKVTPRAEPTVDGCHTFSVRQSTTRVGSGRCGTYAATLTANRRTPTREPETALTEITNSPRTPRMILKPHRKGASSDSGESLEQRLDALVFRDALQDTTPKQPKSPATTSAAPENDPMLPQRFVRWQEDHIRHQPGAAEAFRNRQTPSHLPPSVAERIACECLLPREREQLTKQQRARAVRWGLDRANFASLKEWRKMADSSQVWTLLGTIGCLEYQREE